MVKVSIIIPIYNCEPYLRQCVESVLRQTLKETEVICVDDGSADQSVQMIRELMQSDDRVILCQQKNQGPGIARNTGIKRAKGKYIAFLDADDFYWDIDGLEQLWNACETKKVNAGVSLRWCLNGQVEKLDCFMDDFEDQKIFHFYNHQEDYFFCCYLFLREMLIEKKIYFPPYIRFEDPPFLARALYEADQFVAVDTCLYHYRRVDAKKRFNGERTLDLLCGLTDNLTFAREHHLNALFYNTVRRLEYEYMGIILENILPDDVRIVEKLLKINKMIGEVKGDANYTIRPLRGILLYTSQYEDKIIRKIKAYDEIVLYGAGRYGRTFLKFLKEKNCFDRVSGIVVTERKQEKLELEGIKVVELKELKKTEKGLILVTVGEKLQPEIEETLKVKGYKNYEIVRDEFLYLITERLEC